MPKTDFILERVAIIKLKTGTLELFSLKGAADVRTTRQARKTNVELMLNELDLKKAIGFLK